MLKFTAHIITVILILTLFGCKEDSVPSTVDFVDPAVPVLTSPLNNSLFKSDVNTIQLIWTDIEEATSYQLQVSDYKNFSNKVLDEEGYSTSQYLMKNNNGDGIYYWRIRSVDLASNMSDWSEAKAFLVGYKKDIDYTEDIDGNIYRIVKIGDQWWMAENLAVTHYRNGDAIPNVIDNDAWRNKRTGAYCAADNDKKNADTYGYLYNWYAVDDSRKIAPVGWHVSTEAEWNELEMSLGMSQTEANRTEYIGTDEGGKLKGTGTTHWNSPNVGATDEFGFTALAGGNRRPDNSGYNNSLGEYARFWASTKSDVDQDKAWNRGLPHDQSTIYRATRNLRYGFNLRCLRD